MKKSSEVSNLKTASRKPTSGWVTRIVDAGSGAIGYRLGDVQDLQKGRRVRCLDLGKSA